MELLHQILGHRYTRSLLAGDTTNVWQYIELRIYPDPFCTLFQISTINKKSISKTPLNPRTPFKWAFIDTIPAKYYKSLTKENNLDNYLLIVDAYYNIPKIYAMENITTEEVMDKLDMFQEIFGKVHEFGWWDMEIITNDAGMQFTSKEF